MSSKEDIDTNPARQLHSTENSEIGHRAEFYRLGCIVLRLIIIAVSEACARNWGRRLEMMGQAAFIPDEGYGDINAVAAKLNMEVPGARKLVAKIPNLRKSKPGTKILYRYEDIARLAPQVESSECSDEAECSTGVAPSEK